MNTINNYFNIILFIFIFFNILTIIQRNTIHSLIGLIFVFVSSTILMIFLNYEFFAFIYLIVYIGAISIFFLFAVMLLDLKYEETPHFFSFWTILHLIYFILFTIVYLYYYTQIFLPIKIEFIFDNNIFKNNYFENIFLFTNSNLEIQNIPMVTDVISIGSTIYFEYAIFIIVSGIILFIALFAIILLTFEVINKYFKYQEIISQLNVKNNIIITE